MAQRTRAASNEGLGGWEVDATPRVPAAHGSTRKAAVGIGGTGRNHTGSIFDSWGLTPRVPLISGLWPKAFDASSSIVEGRRRIGDVKPEADCSYESDEVSP